MLKICILSLLLPLVVTLHLELRSFKMCKSATPYPNIMNVTFTSSLDRRVHYSDFFGNFTKPMGRLSIVTSTLEYATQPNRNYIRAYSIKKRDVCAYLNEYFGEFYNEITLALAWPKGVCPIPTGIFRFKHHKLDFNRLTFVAFPLGYIRITVDIKDEHSKDLCCVVFEGQNR